MIKGHCQLNLSASLWFHNQVCWESPACFFFPSSSSQLQTQQQWRRRWQRRWRPSNWSHVLWKNRHLFVESLHAWSGRDPACYRGRDSNAPTRLAFAGTLQTDALKLPQPSRIPIKEMFHRAVPPLPPTVVGCRVVAGDGYRSAFVLMGAVRHIMFRVCPK